MWYVFNWVLLLSLHCFQQQPYSLCTAHTSPGNHFQPWAIEVPTLWFSSTLGAAWSTPMLWLRFTSLDDLRIPWKGPPNWKLWQEPSIRNCRGRWKCVVAAAVHTNPLLPSKWPTWKMAIFLYASLKVPARRMLVAKLYFRFEGFLKNAFRWEPAFSSRNSEGHPSIYQQAAHQVRSTKG